MAPATATRAAAAGVPAQAEPDRQQHRGLQQLDGDDRDDLGAEQARPAERRGAQSLEHAVAALEAGGDAERHHGGRHHGEREDAGHEEVRRRCRRRRDHGDLREEDQEHDRDAEGEQQRLAAAQGHVDLGAGLGRQGAEELAPVRAAVAAVSAHGAASASQAGLVCGGRAGEAPRLRPRGCGVAAARRRRSRRPRGSGPTTRSVSAAPRSARMWQVSRGGRRAAGAGGIAGLDRGSRPRRYGLGDDASRGRRRRPSAAVSRPGGAPKVHRRPARARVRREARGACPRARCGPRDRITMRSAILSASASSCVVSTTQTPRSLSPATTARMATRPSGSTPAVGSSRNATSGRPISARARESRCCSPPERWRHGVVATAAQADQVEQLVGGARDRGSTRQRGRGPDRGPSIG